MKIFPGRACSTFALACALLATIAGAQPVKTFRPVNERQPLAVAAPRDAYPYSFVNERGEWDGFASEIVDAVANTMHLRIARTALASADVQAHFQKGEFDLAQHLQQTADREAWADFSVPLVTLQGAIFVRQGGPIHRLADLAGAEFAIFNINSTGERFLAARGLKVRFVRVDSPAAALRAVQEGRAAGTFVSQLTGLSIARRDGLTAIAPLGESIEGFDVRHCLAVHKGDAQLLARFNEGLAILHENGEFDQIYRKWFGHFGGQLFTREELVSYVAAALALACFAAVWGFWRQRTLRCRIEELNAALERRVSERTAELHARVAEVEALNQELEAFSYSVSHDLRTPLRNVSGFLELLTQRLTGRLDTVEARYVETVSREAARLSTLITELLAFSKVGRSAMSLARVSLDELVAEVRAELSPATAGRLIEWRVEALPTVEGDRAMLRLVFVNLLSNAVKFTRQRSPATIELGVSAPPDRFGWVTIVVRDNGAGFNPKYADKLFGVFQRLHNQRDFEGTGIGLANVKRIVLRHGGEVWAEGNLDKGAAFYLKLKVSPS